jgi:hypothetical protein
VASAAPGQELPFEQADGWVRLTLPHLELLDVVVLEC